MLTPADIAGAIAYLRAARLAGAPADTRDIAAVAEVWRDALVDLDPADLRAACAAWCRESRWWPTPADIRARAPAAAAQVAAADAAWAAIRAAGYYGDISALAPAYRRALAAVGGRIAVLASEERGPRAVAALRAEWMRHVEMAGETPKIAAQDDGPKKIFARPLAPADGRR